MRILEDFGGCVLVFTSDEVFFFSFFFFEQMQRFDDGILI